ncbi:MAG: methyltransferase family protein [Promethearchaeati archaeon]
MSKLFIIFLISLLLLLPIHFLSVSHINLEERFGHRKGIRIGKFLGLFSGWGFFINLFGIWFSPQPRFVLSFLNIKILFIPFLNIPIYLIHTIIAIPMIILSSYLGIMGVKETTLEVSETHKANKVISEGIYSQIRHPQYLGAIIAHLAFSFLFAGLLSILISPLIFIYNYLISWKEEKELIKEFGEEYLHYKRKVPMFIPKFLDRNIKKE